MSRVPKYQKRVWSIGLFVCGLWVVSGCGPVTYVHQVVLKANSAVEAAKVHKAHRYAPYEYYGAVAYLEQARVRAGFGDFQVAVRYGRKSEKMAKKSIKLTKERIDAQTDVGTGSREGPTPPSTRKGLEKPPEAPEKPSR